MYIPPRNYQNFRRTGASGNWELAQIDRVVYPLFKKTYTLTQQIARDRKYGGPWFWVETGHQCNCYVEAAVLAHELKGALDNVDKKATNSFAEQEKAC